MFFVLFFIDEFIFQLLHKIIVVFVIVIENVIIVVNVIFKQYVEQRRRCDHCQK